MTSCGPVDQNQRTHFPYDLFNRLCRLPSRIYSALSAIPNSIISKIQKIAKSVFERKNSSIIQSQKLKHLREDGKKINEISLLSFLFAALGFSENKEEWFSKSIIFDLDGIEQKISDRNTLNGFFQMQWKIESQTENVKLIYRGNFQNGEFHGEGMLFTQSEEMCKQLYLEGLFEQGKFVSGILVRKTHYINGDFLNGTSKGTGTIHYFDYHHLPIDMTILKDTQNQGYLEYQGTFYNAEPVSSDKWFFVTGNAIKLIEGMIWKSNTDSSVFNKIINWTTRLSTRILMPWHLQKMISKISAVMRSLLFPQQTSDVAQDGESMNFSSATVSQSLRNRGITIPRGEDYRKGKIFNDRNQKQNSELSKLNGKFKVEWTLKADCPDKLIYNGHFSQGVFHGTGLLYYESDHSNLILLDGLFEKGLFNAGRVSMTDYYIDGIFTNAADMTGKGVIHYIALNKRLNSNHSFEYFQKEAGFFVYRGNFAEGMPHGRGKMFFVNQNGDFKIVGMGEYTKGEPLKGTFHHVSGKIYEGKFENHGSSFVGKIDHRQSLYEGEVKNNEYHGPGKLIEHSTLTYVDLDDGQEISKTEKIVTTFEGTFSQNRLVNGKKTIKFESKSVSESEIKQSEIRKTTIIRGNNTYIGNFPRGIPEGTGCIFNEGNKVYEGEIKYGVPHGSGQLFNNNRPLRRSSFNRGAMNVA